MSACGCDGGGLRPLDEALEELLERVPAPPTVEWLSLDEAHGRVLGTAICAPADVPAWDNSAMDGYALRASDLPIEGGWLPIGGRLIAGDAARQPLAEGCVVRIFTGAALPPGADTVVPQEKCRSEGSGVVLPPLRRGQHVRRRGEEMRAGMPLLEAGQVLRAPEIGLLASLGLGRVPVYRRLRVALISSGNELREPGEPLAPGQIYNANRYCLSAILRGLGLQVQVYPSLPDDLGASRDALSLAAEQCDVLLSSGGVSVGEEDHLKQAISQLGELHLWRLAIQPGKPLAFGSVQGKPWLGLPGNPAAALVTALVVARPFLLRAQGCQAVQAKALQLPAAFRWDKANNRRQYLRARIEDGNVVLHPQQGSAMLLPACWAEGLAVVEQGRTLGVGESVAYLPFSQLLAP